MLVLAACGDSSGSDDAAESQAGSTSVSSTDATTGAGSTAAVDSTGGGDSTGAADPCAASADAMADCVDATRYADDLGFVADIRTPGTTHWQAVQDLCADRFAEYGLEVELQSYASGVNVIGRKVGATTPEQIVLVGAHYDHIEDCHGADDNASGIAGLLEMARVMSAGTFDRTVMFACWDEEELGLVGSEAFAATATTQGLQLSVVFNFDMIGSKMTEPDTQTVPTGFDAVFPTEYAELEARQFAGDFVAMIGDFEAHDHLLALQTQGERIGLQTALLELPESTETSDLFADLRRSDHASFWDTGVPAIFLTDTGEFRNPHYHCTMGPDEVADVDVPFAVDVTRITTGAMATAAGVQ